MTPCTKEREIDELYHALNGNGKPGLKTTVAILDKSVNENTQALNDLKTCISSLQKFQDETIGELKATEKLKANQRWLVALLITSTIAISGIIIKIYA